ncbi:hypothetical protein N7481_008802 [Penicillium waksmanii]|uniref:uncharacterized protein n=1 Tax=Penicillium waksmanii TaxID=69791 RepID=UPI0025468C22|nr:uncharacterized protein N7481_008802 [Penicillium waksmanii]KAJ5975095.1 hypothetical protein N7481_008802 [Penicillium waksmanii]
MPPRRSHQKSHTGCITCKRRHVKCDESGPPCKRCKTRDVNCEYAEITTRPQISPNPSQDTAEAASPDYLNSCPTFPANPHHLDLQLMHRWSTGTYKSCCTPGSGDEKLWQLTVPALALQYDFLLNGILALSAFESANALLLHQNDEKSNSNREKYINSAIERHVLALSNFRTQLSSSSPCADHRAAICFSLMMMVLTFATVRFGKPLEKNIVKTAIAHFELVRGAVQIAESDEEHRVSQNEYAQKLTPFQDLPLTTLDPAIANIMADVRELNDERIVHTVWDTPERRIEQVALWEACKKALSLLQDCFERCVGPVYRGYALGWLNMAGEEYVRALKGNDNVALLILMMWGVLVERLGNDVWWAQEFGNSLVDEISNEYLRDDSDPSIQDVMIRVQKLT